MKNIKGVSQMRNAFELLQIVWIAQKRGSKVENIKN